MQIEKHSYRPTRIKIWWFCVYIVIQPALSAWPREYLRARLFYWIE
jgi:hypothetical protein